MDAVNFGLNITNINSSELNNLTNTPIVILDSQKDSVLLLHRIVCSYFLGTMKYVSSSSNLINA